VLTTDQEKAVRLLRAEAYALARAFDAERGNALEVARLRSFSLENRKRAELLDLDRIEGVLTYHWLQWPDEASGVPGFRRRLTALSENVAKARRWIEAATKPPAKNVGQ